MMVSQPPAASPPPTPQDAPPETPEVPPPAPIAPAKLQPSPFLNGFDLVLVLGTIVLGFAIASFAVRNADFWQHLGAGKVISEGRYEFGKDPFSYSTEGRTWVNPSWLYDIVVYKLYAMSGGRAVVIFKAVLIALVAGLLLFARRPGQSLWIGVMCVGLALLAAAPRLVMDPVVMSLLFLAATIWLLVHAGRFTGCWSLPIAFAAVFALWSNCDEWFILGPITLGLFLVGEVLQRKRQPAKEGEPRMRLGPLATALIAGTAACMLNPHHVGVWRLPVEMQPSVGAAVSRDAAFAPIFRSTFERGGLDLGSDPRGNPLNGAAFLALVLLNAVALILGRRHVSWGLLLVNSALLALAAVRQRAIPFYAIAAAPITAIYIGWAVQQLKERTWSRGTLQILAGGRAAVRTLLFVAGLAALAAAYPGWLHPLGEHRRLAWAVIPDPSLEKAARRLNEWREDGRIPADVRSLILHPDLAAYCAFYAPAEKTWFDARVALHAPEADSFFKVRQNLVARKPGDPRPPEFDVDSFLADQRIAFVVMTGRDRQERLNSFLKFSQIEYTDVKPAERRWQLWDITGNTYVFGWTRQKAMPDREWRGMRFDPLARAFGPDVKPVPDAEIPSPPPPAQMSFIDKMVRRYLDVPPEPSAGADESQLINKEQDVLLNRFARRLRPLYVGLTVLTRICRMGSDGVVEGIVNTVVPIPPQFRATAVLAIRAARQGIAESPNHPDGYFALAAAYNSPAWAERDLLSPDIRELVTVSNLSRYYLRLATEQTANITDRDAPPLQAARQLFQMHMQRGRLDLAAEFLRKWWTGLRACPRPLGAADEELLRDMTQVGSDPRLPLSDAEVDEGLKRLEQVVGNVEQTVRKNDNLWTNNTARIQSQFERAIMAQQYGLFRKSLQELNAVDTGEGSKLTRQELYAVFFGRTAGPMRYDGRIRLNLIVGQAEEAEEIIRMIDDGLQKQQQTQQTTDFDQPELRGLRTVYQDHILVTSLVLGRFSEMIRILKSQGTELQAEIEAGRQRPLFALPAGKQQIPLGLREISALWIAQHLSLRPEAMFAGLLNPFEAVYSDRIMGYAALFRALEEVHFRLGMTYLEQGDNAAAAAQFREVIRSATPRFRTQRQDAAQRLLDLLRSK